MACFNYIINGLHAVNWQSHVVEINEHKMFSSSSSSSSSQPASAVAGAAIEESVISVGKVQLAVFFAMGFIGP
jgi:hypothetical protein